MDFANRTVAVCYNVVKPSRHEASADRSDLAPAFEVDVRVFFAGAVFMVPFVGIVGIVLVALAAHATMWAWQQLLRGGHRHAAAAAAAAAAGAGAGACAGDVEVASLVPATVKRSDSAMGLL
jgi:hypothetical protein